ncbi:hypothetical protein C4K35_1909 [Pseudomonas chlororaphis subsp. piscium]|uniref:hypothetical protein n=1 Tax=Pseudomonas chlororaphis TaxID=587753 RepID=UPI000F572D8E|nr:hypothetical protein [Pseudomonas chlororaphis]AZC49502.1 hypothetical protein C4K35_1909 [Pseudomonas chlororaphis subsp. piscium]
MSQLNRILKVFTRALGKLEKLQTKYDENIAVNSQLIKTLEDKNLDLRAERNAAAQAHRRISDLVQE